MYVCIYMEVLWIHSQNFFHHNACFQYQWIPLHNEVKLETVLTTSTCQAYSLFQINYQVAWLLIRVTGLSLSSGLNTQG